LEGGGEDKKEKMKTSTIHVPHWRCNNYLHSNEVRSAIFFNFFSDEDEKKKNASFMAFLWLVNCT